MILKLAFLLLAVSISTVKPLLSSGQDLSTAHQTEIFRQVTVIGASVSAGYGAKLPTATGQKDVRIGDVLRAMFLEGELTSNATSLFFFDPDNAGKEQIDEAIALNPSLVVGVDYLFWFGYGEVTPEPDRSETEQRMRRFERGLKLLEAIDCAIVIGDLPDMSDAVGRMLSESQVPSPEALQALNARLTEWVEGRGNVVVIPVNDLMERIRAGEMFAIGPATWTEAEVANLLTEDRLHLSHEGLVAAAFCVRDAILEKKWASPDKMVSVKADARQRLTEHFEKDRTP